MTVAIICDTKREFDRTVSALPPDDRYIWVYRPRDACGYTFDDFYIAGSAYWDGVIECERAVVSSMRKQAQP
jgi:hypothetical protein